MTAKELRAEVKTVKAITQDKTIILLCDVLLDIIKAIEPKDGIGFMK